MITDTKLSIFSVFIFLGIFQGLILSYFFIKKGSKKGIANIFQGILLFALSCAMLEEFLNETGYIVQVLWLTNFAEPFNFAFAPLFYLYAKRSLRPDFQKKDLLHFIIFVLWIAYMMFHFTQSTEMKYNSYVDQKHPEWPFLEVDLPYSDDPLGIRNYTNLFTAIHFVIYMIIALRFLVMEPRKAGINVFTSKQNNIRNLRNVSIHFTLIVFIFFTVKLTFPSDVGDYFISTYISFMIISTSIRILNNSTYFEETTSFLSFPLIKYRKSTLSEEAKTRLLKRIENEMYGNRYALKNMASLSGLSGILNESTHHVSQVINEKLGMNFFELLAKYRIDEAKKILKADKEKSMTIEFLADEVGYNSKSSFNNAFKKLTGMTPSEFRNQ
jgi:AraC-like DNA-binding protein